MEIFMKTRQYWIVNILIANLLLAACASQVEATPTVDTIGTLSAELASVMLTQTAMAHSLTPPPPTSTLIPAETETQTPEQTFAEPAATSMPKVIGPAPCYTGPGPSYALTSNISDFKDVELIGIGSVPGWYVIENPYFWSPCWIAAEHLTIFDDIDLSAYPVIAP
jgi:hypothetical protein